MSSVNLIPTPATLNRQDTVHWNCRFQVLQPIAGLPRPLVLASETRTQPGYRFAGRDRQDDHLCFQYTLEGEGRFRDSHGEHPLPPGTGFLTRITDPEIEYYFPPGGRPWRFVYFAFTDGVANRLADGLMARFGHVLAVPPTTPGLRQWLDGDALPPLYTLQPYAAAALVHGLLATLEGANAPTVDPHRRLVEHALSEIRDGLATPMTVADLARRVGVSREHFSRVCRETLGIAPQALIRREKMRHAGTLLAAGAPSVKEIAAACGYASSAPFCRHFKALTGTTPTAYRAHPIPLVM